MLSHPLSLLKTSISLQWLSNQGGAKGICVFVVVRLFIFLQCGAGSYFGLDHRVFVVVWLFRQSHRHHATEIILYLPAQHLDICQECFNPVVSFFFHF